MKTKKTEFRIVPKMIGKDKKFIVERYKDVSKSSFFPWGKPKCIGKEWIAEGNTQYMGDEYGGVEYISPYFFKSNKKAEKYIRELIETEK
jgi:hypothetical protein